jgi:hypothetical protein
MIYCSELSGRILENNSRIIHTLVRTLRAIVLIKLLDIYIPTSKQPAISARRRNLIITVGISVVASTTSNSHVWLLVADLGSMLRLLTTD